MDRILELQALHDLELPEEFSFPLRRGIGDDLRLYDEAVELVTQYLDADAAGTASTTAKPWNC